MATLFRPPLITRIWHPDPYRVAINSQLWVDGAQNVNLLLGQDKLPFSQDDWPNPGGYLTRQKERTREAGQAQPDVENYLLPNLLGQDKLPFSQDDWPNPRGPRYASDLRTWINQYNNPLNFSAPFSQDDWPNPRGYTFSNDLRGWINQYNNPLYFVVATFSQTDWPVPQGPNFDLGVLGWSNLNLSLGSSTDQFFGLAGNPNFDWPNPRGPQYPTSLRDWQQSTNLPLTTVAFPFSQTDWPNPRGQPPRQDWQNTILPALYGQDLLPFRQGDWPNPRGHRPRQDWQQSTNLPLATVVNPFFQTDWPNPRGHRPRQDWQQGVRLNLLGQDALPFRQSDWPNPRAPLRASTLTTWLADTKLNLYFQGAPFYQTDWPNPQRVVYRQQFWTESLKLNLLGQDKFFGLAGHPNFDWPNPQIPRQPVVLYTPNFVVLTTTVTPAAVSEWHWNPGAAWESGWGPGIGLGWAQGMDTN